MAKAKAKEDVDIRELNLNLGKPEELISYAEEVGIAVTEDVDLVELAQEISKRVDDLDDTLWDVLSDDLKNWTNKVNAAKKVLKDKKEGKKAAENNLAGELSKQTVGELRGLAKDAGIAGFSKMNKQALIDALIKAEKKEEEPEPEPEVEEEVEVEAEAEEEVEAEAEEEVEVEAELRDEEGRTKEEYKEVLQSLKVEALKAIANLSRLKGYSDLKKDELVDAIADKKFDDLVNGTIETAEQKEEEAEKKVEPPTPKGSLPSSKLEQLKAKAKAKAAEEAKKKGATALKEGMFQQGTAKRIALIIRQYPKGVTLAKLKSEFSEDLKTTKLPCANPDGRVMSIARGCIQKGLATKEGHLYVPTKLLLDYVDDGQY